MVPRTTKGFTLVEVIVSVVLVALTAAGIFASFIAAQKYVSRSRGKVSASNAMRQQVEALKAEVKQQAWDPINASYAPNCDPDVNGLAITNGTPPFNCQSSCGSCASCTVSAEVGWTCWKNFNGTFGQPPWNGRRRYRVTEVTAGGPRQVEVQRNWTEPGT